MSLFVCGTQRMHRHDNTTCRPRIYEVQFSCCRTLDFAARVPFFLIKHTGTSKTW